ncbi:SRS domain-containing protein [Neospora caninum Liverpool]|uniref:SRS domain-containing protein n=1 Tax=Neospora caninum (strain Liverpool) TaxID=572307 RepID=F0VCW0_NEOCL|nr:SRS domain-containing protein [Neospora caninum Liverpool]CBZ51475.1 SRS domain-containing protein [Neospora caninum Liverpool]CEL65425.1 TPA: SRS domain-containing protein [Neospora caninum Liverpool]|eukprot:XP_003881508.1 SRS domain-containing protein [Neospora caninum Liverpool]
MLAESVLLETSRSRVGTMGMTQGVRRLYGSFRSMAAKLTAICLSGVVLLSAGQDVADKFLEVLQHRNSQDTPQSGNSQSGPTFTNGIARCELSTAGPVGYAESPVTELTLSKENLTAKLECSGQNNVAVPSNLANVCDPNQKASDGTCNFGAADSSQGNGGKEVTLQTLLGAGEHVKWKKEKSTPRTEGNGETWSLSFTEGDLPLTDKRFLVGCQSSENVVEKNAEPSCKVPVHVEARPSSETNNVVTCAYGQNSNTNALEVELTAEKNAVTIECGSVGSLMPGITTTHYCAPDDGNLDDCTAKKYVDALPMFEESWVKQDGEKSSVTLTIPESGFPVEDQKLRLGCVPKADSTKLSSRGETATAFGEKTSSCNVIVTVRASNAPSSAVSTLQAAAVASGAVAVAGVLSGSLF